MPEPEPLLLPAASRVEFTEGLCDLGRIPLPVTGIDREFIGLLNEICESLPGVDLAGSIFNPAKFDQCFRNRKPVSAVADANLPLFQRLHENNSILNDRCQTAVIDVQIGIIPDFNCDGIRNEAYRLIVSGKTEDSSPKIRIESETVTGVRYAFFTLMQLIRQYGRFIPGMIIEDAPAFRNRAVMLDVSRDRVPRMDELKRTVNMFVSLKFNHLQLYTEHTFAYAGHEEVWRDASPLTANEVKDLDDYCLARGITLAANQNCFGHMARWLKHPIYEHLAETTGEWDFYGHPRTGPFSLCPADPGSIDLVSDLLHQLLPNFSSKLVNIGCDEVVDVGQGRSKDIVRERGGFAVYWDFVRKVMDIALDSGYRPMFWADMLLKKDRLYRGLLPAGAVSLAWGYEPDSPFREWCEKLSATGEEFWVCPGTSSWCSFTGRTSERRGNIAKAADEGLHGGASGFMVTDWGDHGHRQQWIVSLNAVAEAACHAWNPSCSGDGLERSISLHVFGDYGLRIGNWLNRLGDIDLNLKLKSGKPDNRGKPTPLRNSSVLFMELHHSSENKPFAGSLDEWLAINAEISSLVRDLPAIRDRRLNDQLQLTLKICNFIVNLAILRRGPCLPSFPKQHELTNRLDAIISEHCRLWLQASRAGGLEDSSNHYRKVLQMLNKND